MNNIYARFVQWPKKELAYEGRPLQGKLIIHKWKLQTCIVQPNRAAYGH